MDAVYKKILDEHLEEKAKEAAAAAEQATAQQAAAAAADKEKLLASLKVRPVGDATPRKYRLRLELQRHVVATGPRRADEDAANHDKKNVIDEAGDDASTEKLAQLVRGLMQRCARRKPAQREKAGERVVLRV